MAGQYINEGVDRFKDTFKLFDRDGDGKITAAELKSAMKSLNGVYNDRDISNLIAGVDTDADGKISFQEFVNVLSSSLAADSYSDAELKEVFRLFDTNNDGLVTGTELREGFLKLGDDLSEDDVTQMILRVDVQGQGALTFEAFVELMRMK